MMDLPPLEELTQRAEETATLLSHLANANRLLILCRLAMDGEASVGALCAACNLSQSAMSQHLARMRDEQILAVRRDGTTSFYRIADEKTLRILQALKEIMCP